ncbi:MAG: hypothetical protein WCJ84_06595 [Candidatus Peregrinibacteria bacterium]
MDFFSPLKKRLDAFQKALETPKALSLQTLENFRSRVLEETDMAIQKFQDQKELIRLAISKKTEFLHFREGVWSMAFPLKFRLLLSAPFIYGMIIPAVFFHFALEIYHQVCFRLYHIPRLHWKEYFIFDRNHLSYLNGLEKANCWYCSYFNGLVAYAREIAGRTERFWCPIKNAQYRKDPHSQYPHFVEYLEGAEFRKKKQELRNFATREEKVGAENFPSSC